MSTDLHSNKTKNNKNKYKIIIKRNPMLAPFITEEFFVVKLLFVLLLVLHNQLFFSSCGPFIVIYLFLLMEDKIFSIFFILFMPLSKHVMLRICFLLINRVWFIGHKL